MITKSILTRLDIIKNPTKYRIDTPRKYFNCINGLFTMCQYALSNGIEVPIDLLSEYKLMKDCEMGCWNGTDFLGGMPLVDGEEIRAVVILNRVNPISANGHCYGASGYATPISFMIKGTYNDYGGIDFDENQIAVQTLKEMFKENFDKIKIEYSSYDKETFELEDFDKIDGMNKFINDYIERDKVMYKGGLYGSENQYNPLGFVMMSEHTLSSVIKKFKFPSYIKETDIDQDVEYFIEDAILTDKSDDKYSFRAGLWDDESVRKTGKWLNLCRTLSDLNLVNAGHFRQLLRIIKASDEIKANRDELKYMISDFIKMIQCLEELRISWRADSGKGSQHFGADMKLALIDGILKQINNYYNGSVEYKVSKTIIDNDEFDNCAGE